MKHISNQIPNAMTPITKACARLATISTSVLGGGRVSEYISKESIVTLLEQYGYIDKEMERDLASIPSADVRPNIHARWESDGHGHIICTACKGAKLNTHRSKFCDSCGAIMDGERPCEHCLYHEDNGCTRWVCADIEDKPE